jgi:hypothetical protein
MLTTIAIVLTVALVALVAIVRPTELELAARGLRVRMRRRADQPQRDRDARDQQPLHRHEEISPRSQRG